VIRLLRLLALSSHPGPTATVTVLAAGLALALGYGPGRVGAVAVAVLLGQLSIGLSNDWIDAERDRTVGRSDKPVARGEVTVGQVRAAALLTAAACVVASAALGPAFLLAHAVLVGSGWAYNAGIKRTAASVVPFVVAFGILPTVVALGAAAPVPAAGWATATGAVLGVSIHFTNVLPDLDDDARTGVRGLPHRLGRVPSGLVAFGALALGALVVAAGPVLAGPAQHRAGRRRGPDRHARHRCVGRGPRRDAAAGPAAVPAHHGGVAAARRPGRAERDAAHLTRLTCRAVGARPRPRPSRRPPRGAPPRARPARRGARRRGRRA
jgi:4-hydroxybenzoate polyprenyltransferase